MSSLLPTSNVAFIVEGLRKIYGKTVTVGPLSFSLTVGSTRRLLIIVAMVPTLIRRLFHRQFAAFLEISFLRFFDGSFARAVPTAVIGLFVEGMQGLTPLSASAALNQLLSYPRSAIRAEARGWKRLPPKPQGTRMGSCEDEGSSRH
jgi:hypothetical protein